MIRSVPIVDDFDITSTFRNGGLNRVGCDRHFADTCAFRSCVDIDLRGRLRFCSVLLVIVVFNIVSSDLQVTHFAFLDSDSAQPVIANVTAADINLVEIDPIHKYADAGIVIDMAIRDQYVSVSLD